MMHRKATTYLIPIPILLLILKVQDTLSRGQPVPVSVARFLN